MHPEPRVQPGWRAAITDLFADLHGTMRTEKPKILGAARQEHETARA